MTVLVKVTFIIFLKRCSFFDEKSEKQLLLICHSSQVFQKKNLFDMRDNFSKLLLVETFTYLQLPSSGTELISPIS